MKEEGDCRKKRYGWQEDEYGGRDMDAKGNAVVGKRGMDGMSKEMVCKGLDVRRKKMMGRDEDGRRKEIDGEGGMATVRRGMDVMEKAIVVRGMSG